MPTLTEPPPPAALARRFPRSSPSSQPLELPAVSFFGRTLAEYAQFFALDLAALRKRDVLDVAAGPSSFAAEACARGIDAVAIDPLYTVAPAELAARVEADYAHMFAQMRARPRLFRCKSFPSLAAAETILLDAERLHPAEPTIQFNLGCYACQRGALAEARRRVDRAIALDKKFATAAATDPDLAPLRAAERADCPPPA